MLSVLHILLSHQLVVFWHISGFQVNSAVFDIFSLDLIKMHLFEEESCFVNFQEIIMIMQNKTWIFTWSLTDVLGRNFFRLKRLYAILSKSLHVVRQFWRCWLDDVKSIIKHVVFGLFGIFAEISHSQIKL
jgi:hypothetical protein